MARKALDEGKQAADRVGEIAFHPGQRRTARERCRFAHRIAKQEAIRTRRPAVRANTRCLICCG